MTTTRSAGPADASLARDLLYAARHYLGGRRGLLILAGLALIAGLALNWGWLVAAGVAPILIGALPCLAMCALGLCMNRESGRSCSSLSRTREPARMADDVPTGTQAVAPGASQGSPGGEPLPSGSSAAPQANPEPKPPD